MSAGNGPQAIRSDLLGDVAHGFFTRAGGASSGIFAGLNCGTGSSDQASIVATNRARVARAMGGPLHGVHQVHSAEVAILEDPPREPAPRADALLTDRPGAVLTVLSADCQPVLFYAPGLVAAAHAGWKGALAGVLEATVEAMVAHGAVRSEIRAAIGPCISQRVYEVGQDFLDRFEAEDPDALAHFANGRDGRYQFDLPGYGLRRLRAAGVEAEWTGHCTYSDPARFYSYRRATHAGEADYGRLISAIRL
jgi:YfiH family protein